MIEELKTKATAMLPRLRGLASQTEKDRRVSAETIEAFRDAGLIRALQPKRFGGFELDYGTAQIELGSILGQACGSSAWVQSVLASHGWIMGMYPPDAQEAVWGDKPETIVGTAFTADTGVAKAVDGGYEVQGQWKFSSGCDAAEWIIVGAPVPGERARPKWCLLPKTDWEIVDTWFAPGLKGSGSKDIRIPGAFVPNNRILDPNLIDGRPTPGSAINPSYLYRLPLNGFFPFNIAPPGLGIARGAIEAYIEQTAGRPERAGSPPRQLRVSESSAEVDAADALLRADAAEIRRLGASGEAPSTYLQARLARDLSFATMLCTRAVDRLSMAVGAHGMVDDDPVQRAMRDLHAISNHIAVTWDMQGLRYGALALGLES